jgi:hypothetical protein
MDISAIGYSANSMHRKYNLGIGVYLDREIVRFYYPLMILVGKKVLDCKILKKDNVNYYPMINPGPLSMASLPYS